MTDESTPAPKPAPAEMAAALAARLCHDFISPASAVVSGVDLLEDPESQDLREDALSLIATSSRKLAALLQFCRVAFGASASADTFDARDLLKLAEGVFEHQRADLVWAVDLESVNKPTARALLNLAQLGASALPRGGSAKVSATATDGQISALVEASGPSIKLRPEVADGLAGHGMNDGLAGHWVQAYYLASFVEDAGGSLSHALTDEALTIRVKLPA
jgi:histidine phosphotransferase ChpT